MIGNSYYTFCPFIINHIYTPTHQDMDFSFKLAFILLLVALPVASQLPEDDEVNTGFPGYTHPIYSGTLKYNVGYLDISLSTKAKSIHYVYFESQRDVAKDPIIVWLTGGPGCSGLISMLQ